MEDNAYKGNTCQGKACNGNACNSNACNGMDCKGKTCNVKAYNMCTCRRLHIRVLRTTVGFRRFQCSLHARNTFCDCPKEKFGILEEKCGLLFLWRIL
jgi:hypothetical protein